MLSTFRNLYAYRDLLRVLTWKNIVLRYKQSHLGLAWVVLRPLMLVGIFMVVRAFVGIDSGHVPYALLTYCAMVPWVFFQEAASDGVGSVVSHANLIKKIYFPREIFPLASLLTKCVDLAVGLLILSMLMLWYQWAPTLQALWLLPLILYTMLIALTLSLAGAALNVFSRDMSQGVPLMLSLGMYLSPVMYPLPLVQRALLENQAAGAASDWIYELYILNPMVGVISSFQRCLLMGHPPDWATLAPGAALVAVLLPLSYLFFKRAEAYFADVI
ncbi:MAG: ABC transporter permease [Burkholderiaceae bacterium]|nr:ABC transporter permease [Burkholderiaceae bacterium]